MFVCFQVVNYSGECMKLLPQLLKKSVGVCFFKLWKVEFGAGFLRAAKKRTQLPSH